MVWLVFKFTILLPLGLSPQEVTTESIPVRVPFGKESPAVFLPDTCEAFMLVVAVVFLATILL